MFLLLMLFKFLILSDKQIFSYLILFLPSISFGFGNKDILLLVLKLLFWVNFCKSNLNSFLILNLLNEFSFE